MQGMVDILESPPRAGLVPLNTVGGPTHEYDIVAVFLSYNAPNARL